MPYQIQAFDANTPVGYIFVMTTKAQERALAQKYVSLNRRARHDYFITDTIEANTVKLQWIPSREQQADIFTKALDAQTFLGLRAHLMTR